MPNDVHVLIEEKEIFLELGLSWWGCLILLGVLAVIIGMVCCYRHWKRKVQKQKALRGKNGLDLSDLMCEAEQKPGKGSPSSVMEAPASDSPMNSLRKRFSHFMDVVMPWEEDDAEANNSKPRKATESPKLIMVAERRKVPSYRDLPPELAEELLKPREDFRSLLFRYLNRSGRTNPEIYRAAGMDRKLFSAICTKPHYQPSRGTVIRLALALELTLPEAMEFMERAGYAFSAARPGDLVVTYYISRGIYDVMIIEDALYEIGEHL